MFFVVDITIKKIVGLGISIEEYLKLNLRNYIISSSRKNIITEVGKHTEDQNLPLP